MNKRPMDNQSLPEASPDSDLIQLHLAEYQALTTRASYWIVLQFSLLPVVPVYLAMAFQAWQSGAIKMKEIIIWVTLALLHLVAMLWSQTMLEQFTVVKYIECYLRPQVMKGLNTDKFWCYEPYLVTHRPFKATWGNYSIPVLSTIVIVIILSTRLQVFSRWDAGGLIINLLLMLILWSLSKKAAKMQKEWAECDNSIVQRVEEDRSKVDTQETKAGQ